MMHIFIRSLKPSRLHISSLSKLLVPPHNALLIRWPHMIFASKFTLNSKSGFRCCVPKHRLCFLLSGSPYNDHVEELCNPRRCPLTAAGITNRHLLFAKTCTAIQIFLLSPGEKHVLINKRLR